MDPSGIGLCRALTEVDDTDMDIRMNTCGYLTKWISGKKQMRFPKN